MSLKEDLARNRAVFEKLVGGIYEAGTGYGPAALRKHSPAFYAESGSVKSDSAFSPPDIPASRLTPLTVLDESPAKIESFSLAYGTARRTSMSITPPGPVDAPPLREPAAPEPASDSLEKIYHQLELESRRSSQLLNEEDFFE